MRRTARWSAVVVVAAVAALVTSCSSGVDGGSGDDENVTITFVHIFGEGFDDAIAAFEEANPGITVESESVPFDQLISQTQARLGSGDSSIDVIAVDPPRLPSMVDNGYLLDVSEDFADAAVTLSGPGIQSATWEGAQYSYPLWSSDGFLLYNKALLESAGIAAPSGENDARMTWEEVLVDAQTAQDAGAAYGLGFEQVDRYYQLQPLIESFGASSGLTGEGNLTPDVNSDEWKQWGQWYQDLHTTGLAPVGVDATQMPEMFTGGQVAYFVASSTRVRQFQDSPIADGWGVAPLPYFAGGEVYTPTDSWAVGVSAYSEHQDAAREFGRFLAMSVDGGNQISQIYTLPPVNEDVYPDFVATLEGVAPEQAPVMDALFVVDSQDHALHRPSSIGYVEFETIMNKAFSDIRNGGDVSGILDSAQQQLESQLAQYR
ncbi:ABC transporter substrate-binding protein [Microbacterium sp. bgisy207]|jgi:ABC-type glycerol-3-phosphate transport system substrate-binding protein|uniref:ABC transporter substrate-binding protein n=1 Tax=Microbacterium sp. bgisy207 TaxID=3413800 RepID=UPI003EC149B4